MNLARALDHFSPGSLLDGGKYRVIRQLGAGGMGAIFEAENTLTRKRVAIKCLHAGRAAHPDATARLLREAEAASRIRHPHVVDVYDVGRDEESVFLVMEYLEGETLSQLLARGGMPMHALIALLLPAMRAVAEAHRQGVVHRDIKPDNIFLAREADAHQPVPKVLDFGISKLSELDHRQASLTLSGSTLGTPRYMAYEQLMSDKTIDGRVDVYAFGVILYEALTGRPPFDAETYPELIVKIANGTMPSPKQLRAELPLTLDRLVCWALEKDREQRVSSMEQLIRELEPFATERGMLSEMSVADRVGVPLSAIAFNSTVRSKPAPLAAAPARPAPAKPWRSAPLLSACVFLLGLAWVVFVSATQRAPQPPAAAARVEESRGTALQPAASTAEVPSHTAPAATQEPSPLPAAASPAPTITTEASAPTPLIPVRPAASRGVRRNLKPVATPPASTVSAPASGPSDLSPPPQAAAPQIPVVAPPALTPETAAPTSPNFRVKLPQSKEF